MMVKEKMERLQSEVHREAERYARRLGLPVGRRLLSAIEAEEWWFCEAEGLWGVEPEEQPSTAEETRNECLEALHILLVPSYSEGCGRDWAEVVDQALNALNRWADKAAPPLPAKQLAEWAKTREKLEAAKKAMKAAQGRVADLERELEQRAAHCRSAKAQSGLRLVKRAA